jgi:hypothetical protein
MVAVKCGGGEKMSSVDAFAKRESSGNGRSHCTTMRMDLMTLSCILKNS